MTNTISEARHLVDVVMTFYYFHPRVTASISTIVNKTTPMQLDSATAVAVYVSSLITQDIEKFAQHNFTIRSIYLRMFNAITTMILVLHGFQLYIHCILNCAVDSGSGETIIMTNGNEDQLSGGALSGIVILGLVATLMAITVVLMIVYIRYTTFHNPETHERSPLILDNK